MSTLVTGASGLLGATIRARMAREGEAWGWHHTSGGAVGTVQRRGSGPDSDRVDVRDADAVDAWFAEHDVEVVVHCAADADLASCERDPGAAWALNVEGTRVVARAAAAAGARLVQVSTDCVFRGTAPDGYAEGDPPDPIQVYGSTKAEAERVALDVADALVLRIPLLYGLGDIGARKTTWAAQTVRALRAGERLAADDTEVRQPSLTDDIAEALVRLLADGARGVVHVAAPETTTKHRWSRQIAAALGADPGLVELAPPPAPVPARPVRPTLRVERLGALDIQMPRGVTEALPAYLSATGA